jgi:hypothetical protein
MDSLPKDIFYHLINYLDLVSLFNIRRVCKSWYVESLNQTVLEKRYNIKHDVAALSAIEEVAKKEKLVFNILTDSRLRLSILLLHSLPIYNDNKRSTAETDNVTQKVYPLLLNHEEYFRSRTWLYTHTTCSSIILSNENKQFVWSKWIDYAWSIVWSMCEDRILYDNFFYVTQHPFMGHLIDSLYEPEDNKCVLLYYLHEAMKERGYTHITLDPVIKTAVDKGRDLATEAIRYKDKFTLKTPINERLVRMMQAPPGYSRASRFYNFDEREWLDKKDSTKIKVLDTGFELEYRMEWLSDTCIDLRKSKRMVTQGSAWLMRIDKQEIRIHNMGNGRFTSDVEPEQMIQTLDKLTLIVKDVADTYFKNTAKKQRSD